MNYIDIVILLFLLYGAFRGFSKGLIIEVATLAGLILGVFIAIRYSPFTEGILKDFLNITSRYLSYIALAVTFLLLVIAVYLLGKMLTDWSILFRWGWSINCLAPSSVSQNISLWFVYF